MNVERQDSLYKIFVASCLENLQEAEDALLDLEKCPASLAGEKISAVFRAAHSIKGDAGTIGYSLIGELSHKIENVLHFVREGQVPVSAPLINLLLEGFDQLRSCIVRGENEEPEKVKTLFSRLDACAEASTALPAGPAAVPAGSGDAGGLSGEGRRPARPVPDETAGTKPAGSRADDAGRGQMAHVMVPARQLDELLAPVGELATLQIRLARVARNAGHDQMVALAEEIERISAVLRLQILEMRMLSLDTIFANYRRLVRDLGTSLGKMVELGIEGENIRLDKAVLEKLNVALIHILRNAASHGIESPDRRQAAGKNPEGWISIRARQSGHEVEIEIRDDGSGIDTDRLREKAAAAGLLEPHTSIPEEQLLKLVFLPGISAAEKVDEISGRGVGLDAVLDIIHSLRGKITVESRRGEFTLFRIHIPLSLAIMDCLVVEAGGVWYYLLLDYVLECLDSDSASGKAGLRTGVIPWRDGVLPLVEFRRFFRLDGEPSRSSQVVVVRVKDQFAGLVVDQVIGQQQAVFKDLGPVVGKVEGIQGATLNENGDLALLVDVPGLINSVSGNNNQELWKSRL